MSKVHFLLAVLLVCAVLPAPVGAVRQDGCGEPATFIHDIQGTGERSPESGQPHTIEGVVVGDFQDKQTELNGFFVQEEDSDADSDPLTSEGIFVDSSLLKVDVKPGDVVRVEGTVFELSQDDGAYLTELRRLKSLTVCSSGVSVTPTTITLPVQAVEDWERYEGMLVTFPQVLTVTEVYNLGRYGEVSLSEGGRLMTPTNIALPGPDAQAVEAENALRRVLLDDGNSQQNRDPTAYPAPGLSASNTLRVGDTLAGLVGVVDQSFGVYRVHATGSVTFEDANPRLAEPAPVGGTLRAASFNVLNYFNGDAFPTSRGATTPEEFTRQRDKIISAILDLDADVVGLMEIENDGSGPDSAAADLVDGLNAVAGEGVYAFVPDPAAFTLPEQGADEIKVALIYRPAAVTPVGDAVTTLDAPFGTRRPPIVQAFEQVGTGEQFIVAVNHFKSKGCTDASGDPDTGDGQGCWNQERVQAAHTLTDWLATDPTGTGDPDVLILGDLNSYALEDPVRIIEAAGYVNLLRRYLGESDYSYVYMGASGTLDQALASASLADQVSGATVWHINADEPRVLDYNEEYKSDDQITGFYSPDPYRSSDHDPVLVGLALDGGASGNPLPDTADLDNSTGGVLAIVIGLIAVVLAAVGSFVFERRKK